MKILLFGKNGQVGWELQRALAPLGELIALDAHSTAFCGDLANLSGLTQTVRAVQPDVIVNAAAYTAVDKAENEPDLARSINALAPRVLAEEGRRHGATLVHYSTDYVFDGSGNEPRREDAPTMPLNVYGRTKQEGEQLIEQSGCHHLIFRTSWVFGARGRNFAKTMLKLAMERDTLHVIDDQVGAPTGADLLADLTAHAIRAARHDADKEKLSGLYHVAPAGETSWYDYAQFVLARAREQGAQFRYSKIVPVSSSAYKTDAKRPSNSRLDTKKFRDAFGLSLPDWQNGVARMISELPALSG